MSAMPDASSPLFPGPEIKPRDGLPNLEKVKKPGVLTILAKEGRALPSFINKGIFPIAGQEPLTELQRKAEMFEFSAILEKVLLPTEFKLGARYRRAVKPECSSMFSMLCTAVIMRGEMQHS